MLVRGHARILNKVTGVAFPHLIDGQSSGCPSPATTIARRAIATLRCPPAGRLCEGERPAGRPC